jgi:hypothetical protein
MQTVKTIRQQIQEVRTATGLLMKDQDDRQEQASVSPGGITVS